MDNNQLQRKFGFITAVCLIVGAVIGSGIFFQNATVFRALGGNLGLAVLAWVIGGIVMFTMAYVWAILAGRHESMSGLADYSEALIGRKYGYFLTWFLGTILYPSFAAVLAFVSARFTANLLGWDNAFLNPGTWMLAGVYLIGIYIVNVISTKLAGRFQVSTTFIKVIPLILMGIVGIIVGLVNGTQADSIGTPSLLPDTDLRNPFYVAILATVFAYAGSEEILMFNREIKNSRRNLPLAIIVGSIIIISIYVVYTIGIFGSAPVDELARGEDGVLSGFRNVFGSAAGSILHVFVIISCLGAMNSAMMAGSRTFYSIAIRNMGPAQEQLSMVDRKTNVPHHSAVISLLCSALILLFVFGNTSRWFHGVTNDLGISITALAPITLMAFYIPLFVMVMVRGGATRDGQRPMHWFNRFVMPALAIAGGIFMIYMVFDTNWRGALWYLGGFAVIMGIAALFLIPSIARRGQASIEQTTTQESPN
ncbi:MAG: APC family permease [Firmicutes bacterium]|nr:APC family permease [Bacillota bacterium]